MTILFDLLLRLARAADEDVFESIATGGSATTLVDATCNVDLDDWWNGGTLFFKTGSTGRINTTAIITDFTKTTGTFTFATGTAIAATNQYFAITNKWTRSKLVQVVNTALQKQSVVTEDATLTVVADQIEYSLPTSVSSILRVEAGSTTLGWNISNYWREAPGKLRFYKNEPSEGTIRLTYLAKPAYVNADSAAISDPLNADLAVYDALTELWLQHTKWAFEGDRRAEKRYQDYQAQAERLRAHIHYMNPDPRYSGY